MQRVPFSTPELRPASYFPSSMTEVSVPAAEVSEILGLDNDHDADSSGELLPAVKMDRNWTDDGGKSRNMDSS